MFFYSNEGNEPMHVHARKGDTECKFWMLPETYNVEEAWSHGLTPRLRREIRKVLFDHFDIIAEEWNRSFGGRRDEAD